MAHSRRTYSLWQSFLSSTCLCCTSTESYTLFEEEEEEEEFPSATEKIRYRDFSPPPSSQSPLPPTSEQPMTSVSPSSESWDYAIEEAFLVLAAQVFHKATLSRARS